MSIRKKKIWRHVVLLLAVLCVLMTGITAFAAEKPAYLKSVTYFGDEWPINYWSSEDPHMEANFQRIKEDGFNSIILVVPWREFQPWEQHSGGTEFNEAAFARLNEVMECAARYDLFVSLRVGYTWDYYRTYNVQERFAGVIRNNGMERYMWIRYCERLYQEASAHDNFYGGFVTWEDFWDYTYNMKRDYSKKERVEMARTSGYQEYLEKNYPIGTVSEVYESSFRQFDEIPIPDRDSEAAALFYEFYDQMLNEFLTHTQTVFPGISMEFRADGDKIRTRDGGEYYYSHWKTYPCHGAEYSALMYSVSMGQRNESDRISAAEALAATDRNLGAIHQTSGKKLYVEQLLYMDSTKEFSYNTQILETETDAYIRALGPVLQRDTMGYGLWVYRNYVNNCVYNSQFRLGTEGWEFRAAHVETVDGSPMAKLQSGARIGQEVQGRLTGEDTIFIEFYAKPEKAGTVVTVQTGDLKRQVPVNQAGTFLLEIPWQTSYNLSFTTDGTVWIDNVKLYAYEQYGRIYDRYGGEQDLADDFRILNSQLP